MKLADNELWIEDAMRVKLGDEYWLFGTDTSFEITGDPGAYREGMMKSPKGQEISLQIERQALSDIVTLRSSVRADTATGENPSGSLSRHSRVAYWASGSLCLGLGVPFVEVDRRRW